VHPVAHPRGGGGGGGAQHRPGMKGGRGPKYSNIDGHSGSRYKGGRHDHREGREESEILFNLQHQE
jgi:hypothetical protein